MKHLLILLSLFLLSSPLLGKETGVLYLWETSSNWVWKTFGDKDVNQKYEGEIKYGEPNGFGMSYHPNGSKYVGEFKNGRMDGRGTVIFSDGGKWVGEFRGNKPWNITMFGKSGEILGKQVNGKIVTKDKSVGVVGKKEKEFNGRWTKQLGTSYYETGRGVTTDSSGNIYVTGSTGGRLDGNTHFGRDDIFLVKFNSSGTKQWTKQLGNSSGDNGNGVTTDSSGNIYVTGKTGGGLDGNTNSGKYDIFLIKYNASGI